MHTEIAGPYALGLDAKQLIDNGAWAAFAEVRRIDNASGVCLLSDRQVADHVSFATKEAAIAAARKFALGSILRG